MRVGFDATPAAVQHAGVGRYARELLRSLVRIDANDAYVLVCSASTGECAQLLDHLPPGAARQLRRLPMSERFTTMAWQRLRLPIAVERITGPVEIFHGPDFVLPPARVPRVVTVHDLSFLKTPEYAEPRLVQYLSSAVPRALAGATRIIAVSTAVASDIVTSFPSVRNRVVAIPNGVRVPAALERAAGSSRPTLLCVGTIEPRKNHALLLRALAMVRETHPDVQLVVAGRIGWRAQEIYQALRQAEANGLVRIEVAPDDARLEALYREATVAVSASVYEGFGLPVLEAMVRYVPVIASDIDAHREVGGPTVRYADPLQADSFAEAITCVLDDEDARLTLANAAFRRAATFSWDECALRTRRVYQAAIAEARR
jgi:glycosyltransferase involved in cell wall biosynthesis